MALSDHLRFCAAVERPRFVASTISAAGTTTWDAKDPILTLIQPLSADEQIRLGRHRSEITHRAYADKDADLRASDRLIDASMDAWYDWEQDDIPFPEYHVQAILDPAGKGRYKELLLIQHGAEK